jgi:hypothetical protein
MSAAGQTGSETYSDAPPLQGFLQDESDEEVRISVPGGTWVVKRSDLVGLEDWKDPVGEGDGRPVQAEVRSGAVIGFNQSVKVEPRERPMTMPDKLSQVVGMDVLREMGNAWAGRLGFKAVVDAGAGSSPSACCWETGNWGMDCSPDDCMD